ncbi:hypothetical protein NEPAR03_1719 [Nematocida parisii]|nr:hypothetical protein NEPAR03_1719 [Nematocida parisii]
MLQYSYVFPIILNAVLCLSSSLVCIWKYPSFKSIIVKYLAPCIFSIISFISGISYSCLFVISFNSVMSDNSLSLSFPSGVFSNFINTLFLHFESLSLITCVLSYRFNNSFALSCSGIATLLAPPSVISPSFVSIVAIVACVYSILSISSNVFISSGYSSCICLNFSCSSGLLSPISFSSSFALNCISPSIFSSSSLSLSSSLSSISSSSLFSFHSLFNLSIICSISRSA